MADPIPIAQLAAELREIYRSAGPHAGPRVESYLESRLQGLPPGERSRVLGQLHSEFAPTAGEGKHAPEPATPAGADVYAKVFSLLLGKKVQQKDLSSDELLEKLAASLKTIFDVVNELLNATNAAFVSGTDSDKTIRHVIGLHLSGENQTESLEKYLGQIKMAIISSHEAYKEAVLAKVKNILYELSPRRMEEKCGRSIKFGSLRRAELFVTYEATFEAFQKWLESGKFMDDFITEFERAFQSRLFSVQRRAG